MVLNLLFSYSGSFFILLVPALSFCDLCDIYTRVQAPPLPNALTMVCFMAAVLGKFPAEHTYDLQQLC